MVGVLVLVGAIALVAIVAVVRHGVDGRFRPGRVTFASPPAVADAARSADDAAGAADRPDPQSAVGAQAEARDHVSAADIGAELGSRLTFVQFSSAFCSPCRATRTLLADAVAERPDVEHVEVDAESHLDLVRRLGVLRTPTVLVVDADGAVLSRASGVPRRDQVRAVLDAVR